MPVVHQVGSGSLPLFGSFYSFMFHIPVAATVAYSVSSPTDTFHVAIFDPANWTNYTNGVTSQAYASHGPVASYMDSVTALPAGDYYLGFHCDNIIERCAVTFAVTAVY